MSSNRFLNEVMQSDKGESTDDEARLESASENSSPPSPEPAIQEQNSVMPHEARQVLVTLMRQGVILQAQKPKLFTLLCRYETSIRKHLDEVYLQLMLDQKTGVAFIKAKDETAENEQDSPEPTTETDAPSLITKRTLSLYDTLLLLVLRKYYQERETAGEQKIVIDIERIESNMIPFLPLTDYQSIERKKLIARLKELSRRKLLTSVRGSEERYEITPIIRYVVNAEFLESLLSEYQTLAKSLSMDSVDGDNA